MHARRTKQVVTARKASASQIAQIQMFENRYKKLLGKYLEPFSLLAAIFAFGSEKLGIEIDRHEKRMRIAYDHSQLMNLGQATDEELLLKATKNEYSYLIKRFILTLSLPFFYYGAHLAIKKFKQPTAINTENLTSAEAEEIIRKLKDENRELKSYVERNTKIAKVLDITFKIFLFAYLMSSEKMLQTFISSEFVTALFLNFHILQLSAKIADTKVEEQLEKIKKLLPEGLCTVDSDEGLSLDSSYIIIKFNPYEKIVNANIATQLTRKILLQNGLNIISSRGNEIVVSADFKISTKSAKQIREEINLVLQEYADLRKFKTQMEELGKRMSINASTFPARDKNGKQAYKYFLNIPEQFLDVFDDEVIDTVFANCKIELYKGYLVITGNKSIADNSFDDLLQKIQDKKSEIKRTKKKSGIAAVGSSDVVLIEDNEKTEKTKLQKTEKSKPLTKIELLRKQIAEEKAKQASTKKSKIKFASGTYDPNDTKCTVHEIEGGTRIPANTFFIMSTLTREDLKACPGAFEKIEAMVEKAHLANARKGAEGIVFGEEEKEVKDAKGKSFNFGAKLKFLGVFNDFRAYAELETAKTGEVLCVVKGFKAAAH